MEINQFCNELGFANNPFQYTNADLEGSLPDYFIPPPYFSSVWGDPANPVPTVVLAPRGGGKTAQRRMIEYRALQVGNVLPVTYNRFDFGELSTLKQATLQFHIRNLCRLVTAGLLTAFSQMPERAQALRLQHRRSLRSFVDIYLNDLTDASLRAIAETMRPFGDKALSVWNIYIAQKLSTAFQVFASMWGWSTVEPDLRILGAKASNDLVPLKDHLLLLKDIAQAAGFTSIYVLIDKVDETSLTGNNSEATFRLLEPVLRDLDLLFLSGYGFKFFVWDAIEQVYQQDARPDRVLQYHLQWTRPQLKDMLSKRLYAFSNGAVSSLRDITEDIGTSPDDLVIAFSQKSPRNTIRICERIVSEQLRLNPDMRRITVQAINEGIKLYCEQTLTETHGASAVSEIRRLGRVEFTTGYLVDSVFRTSANACRNKVTDWNRAGLTKQVGEIQKGKRAGRPVYNYRVVDVRAAFLSSGKQNPIGFTRDHLIECKSCRSDQIVDLELLGSNQTVICSDCGASLGLQRQP